MTETSQTYARVIADSITLAGHRLTTMEVRFHRFVLAEFNTHRVFSRNSASSRAIPLSKQLARLIESPCEPVSWPAEQSGMQGGAELPDNEVWMASDMWDQAAIHAADAAHALGNMGVHKSVANRLIEPFMWHTVVVTATAWGNFFAQRCSPLAQPEIRVAAEMMRAAYNASAPVLLRDGDWHLPYLSEDELSRVYDPDDVAIATKVSAARCARVSYLTQDGVRDLDKDLELYERLVTASPMHASPLEHVARPEPWNAHQVQPPPFRATGRMLTLPRYGNLLGWHQLRFDVEAELDMQAYA